MKRARGAGLHRVTRLLTVTVLVAIAARAQVSGELSADDMARIVGEGTSQRPSMLCTLAARAKDGLSPAQVTVALGPLTGGDRWRAVRCLAPKIQSGLTGDDLETLVGEGTAYRDNMLCDLKAQARKNITAAEVAAALGPLTGGSRWQAVRCLAPQIQQGLTGDDLARIVSAGTAYRDNMLCDVKEHAREGITAAEVAAALGPLTGGSRWQAVRCLAPQIQQGLTGDDLSRIVGAGTAYRDNMLCDVKGHVREGITAAEVAAALGPLTGGSRWQAVRCLAPQIQQGLTGDDLSRIVGAGTAYRDNMLCDVKGHVREGITAAEVAAALGPLTGGSRWQAVRCIEPRIQAGMNGLDFAQILGESNSYRANIICDLKSHRAQSLKGAQMELVLSGLSGTQRSVALRCLESTTVASVSTGLVGAAPAPGSPPSAGILGGCGSTKWQRLAVPEYVCFSPYGGTLPWVNLCVVASTTGYVPVYMGEACRMHDACYSAPGARKSQCDASFHELIVATCDASLEGAFWTIGRRNCRNVASEYHHQVSTNGCDAFRTGQQSAGIAQPACD
jgi:hypothetical protein